MTQFRDSSVEPPARASGRIGLLVVASCALALVVYKASSSLGALAKARATGTLLPKAEWLATAPLPDWARPLAATANYFSWVLVALSFGVVLGALVQSLVPRQLFARALGKGAQGQLVAAAAGAPLMLCSCCVAPVFDGVYRTTKRLGPALALFLASPALNPAAIALTFLLFPPAIAWLRLGLASVLVLAATAGIGRVLGETTERCDLATGPLEPFQEDGQSPGRAFAAALRSTAGTALPAVALGALASAALVQLVPIVWPSGGFGPFALAAVAAVSVLVALPTFGEIPIGLTLLAAGAPPGAVVALLVAGPAVNLPSLLTLARVTSPKVAATLAGVVFAVAVAGGLLAGI
jgi:uncharacterized membrane protein YraQ (UPF0718 family)